VLNADDPLVASLGGRARGPVLYYGVDDAACALATPEHAADSRWCGTCGAEYGYRVNFYGHVGHWYCPGCGAARPEPQVRATRVTLTPEGGAAQVETPAGPLDVRLGLAGLYSVYNALAAAATGLTLGLPPEAVQEGLSGVTAAFGRQERIPVWGRTVRVLLCKNPAGTNQVLRTVLADPEAVRVLLVLNDGIADGEDVSWIWDVDVELLAGRVEDVWAGGTRAADMGLRLKYAGLGDRLRAVERDVDAVLRAAVEATPPGGTLYVLPTYTAMLHVRERLAGWGNLGHYWEEE
ncbi:MAG TPA: MurT ligase domain-containing protein, partial [Dehalococcoidia bacterium]